MFFLVSLTARWFCTLYTHLKITINCETIDQRPACSKPNETFASFYTASLFIKTVKCSVLQKISFAMLNQIYFNSQIGKIIFYANYMFLNIFQETSLTWKGHSRILILQIRKFFRVLLVDETPYRCQFVAGSVLLKGNQWTLLLLNRLQRLKP